MTYEVKTPMLLEAAAAARSVIAGISSGQLDVKEAGVINGAAGKLVDVVAGDVRARLAAPRIAAYEAKQIEEAAVPVAKQIAA